MPATKPCDEISGQIAKYKRLEQYGLSVSGGVYSAGLYTLHTLVPTGLWSSSAIYACGMLGSIFALGALAVILFGTLEKLPKWAPGVIGGLGGAGIVFFGCATAGAYAQSVREFADIALVTIVALTVLPAPSLIACARRQGIERGEDESEIY